MLQFLDCREELEEMNHELGHINEKLQTLAKPRQEMMSEGKFHNIFAR